jgi:DNA-directed RNA polymerase subunit RPC12/RpoP
MPEGFPEDDDLDEDGEGFEDLEYDQDDTDQAVCPHCGAEVYDDADRCPKCGQNIVGGSDPGGPRPASGPARHGESPVATWPTWVIVTAIVLAIAFLLFYLTTSPLQCARKGITFVVCP